MIVGVKLIIINDCWCRTYFNCTYKTVFDQKTPDRFFVLMYTCFYCLFELLDAICFHSAFVSSLFSQRKQSVFLKILTEFLG